MENNLTKTHAIVLAGLLAVFMGLTFLITNAGVDRGPEHSTRVWQTTIGAITGPLVGAISRGFQRCCLTFSLRVMAWCAPVLLLGIMVQLVWLPKGKLARVARMVLWTGGWLVWFAGGVFSFAHALT